MSGSNWYSAPRLMWWMSFLTTRVNIVLSWRRGVWRGRSSINIHVTCLDRASRAAGSRSSFRSQGLNAASVRQSLSSAQTNGDDVKDETRPKQALCAECLFDAAETTEWKVFHGPHVMSVVSSETKCKLRITETVDVFSVCRPASVFCEAVN